MALNVVLKLKIEGDLSGPTDDTFTDPVTDGKMGIVQTFGAALPGTGLVELHWGDDIGGWVFIKAIAATTYEFQKIYEEFIGDGVKMFRVRRSKAGGGGPISTKVWFKAVEA